MTTNFGILTKCEIQSVAVRNMIGDKEIELTVKCNDNSRYSLIAKGTSGFHLAGMRLRNIIGQVVFFGGCKFEDREFKRKLFVLNYGRLPKNDPEEYWRRINKETEEVKKQEKVLMEIIPLYGAYILILAHSFSLRVI